VSGAAIETRGLGKRYGRVNALEDLSLRVEAGEVFGFLGPNGAGKTTTIRLVLGLLRASAGTAAVLGRPVKPGRAAWRADIGYLPGELALWPDLTGERTLDLLAALSGRPAKRRSELVRRLGLGADDLRRRVGTYSDGMKQKIGIAQAMQCAPPLLLLDEPTKGLDPLMQQAFYELLGEAREAGATIFFSSHVLSEVERICDRVAMLRAGRLVGLDTIEDVRRGQRRRVVAEFTEDVSAGALATFGTMVVASPRRLEMLVARKDLPALVARLGMLPLADLVIESPGLEEAFLERYR
jgi:ABC-2 type transport system ATP-binding protein